ncbi:uncharacterized protein LOC114747179 [Neltuma alba]|uniref:uncharacterized protein LOC114747179 n=1 Tax=Neltuma alba TaxID=207710 RepID=UPI0010A2C020|nr:uncharacterized protein LOC114747179 [Prosopis alba]
MKDARSEQRPPSFKEKHMGGTKSDGNLNKHWRKELNLEQGDVVINMDGLIPVINFSNRVREVMEGCMEHAVVVKILRPYLRPDILFSKITSLWRPTGDFKLTELEGGCFMVMLENKFYYQNALLGGPWVVQGHYLTVHPWEPTLSPLNLEIKQVYGWVRLPGLPYHYCHKNVLRAIGEVIGQVLKIDYNSEEVDKARYARLAVKLDLTRPLVSMIKLDGVTQYVEYEGLPTICYHCGRYGHLEASCPQKMQQQQPPTMNQRPPMNDSQQPAMTTLNPENGARDSKTRESQIFGSWMKAPTRPWQSSQGGRKETDKNRQRSVSDGNRFEALAIAEDADLHQEGKVGMTADLSNDHAEPREQGV